MLVRIELRAPEQDAALLREIASALADPQRGARTRQLLYEHFDPHAGLGLKELLAAAPLDLELDFDRRADGNREIELLSFLIDTNVISEIRKGARCDRAGSGLVCVRRSGRALSERARDW